MSDNVTVRPCSMCGSSEAEYTDPDQGVCDSCERDAKYWSWETG